MAIKTVRFTFLPTQEVLQLLRSFRNMVNEAIGIGFVRQPKTRFQLITMTYPQLKEHGLHCHYILSACEVAFSILRNHRRRNRAPFAKHLFLKLDSESYKLEHSSLRIPTKPRQFVFIPLRWGEYQSSFLRNPALKRGSLTITSSGTVAISFSRIVQPITTHNKVAFDTNTRSLVGVSTDETIVNYDLSRTIRIRDMYCKIRASVSRKTHRGRKRMHMLLLKYGRRERLRVVQAIHEVSRRLVSDAEDRKQVIVMERLNGIRFSHR